MNIRQEVVVTGGEYSGRHGIVLADAGRLCFVSFKDGRRGPDAWVIETDLCPCDSRSEAKRVAACVKGETND